MRERSNRIGSSCVLTIATIAVLCLFAVVPAHAQTTFVVTDPAESGDGTCDVSCTLTDAILAVNAATCVDVAPCTIAFAGPMSISFAVSPLPVITNSYVTIDAGANGASMLNTNPFGTPWNGSLTALIGPGAAFGWNGIEAGPGTTKIEVVGLHIEGFGTGIKLDSFVSSVRGCWIRNNTIGLILSGPGPAFIGEDLGSVVTDAYRNVFSGNTTGHIQILSPSTGNQIVNNYIGPMPDLSSSPGVDSQWGVKLMADSNTIGLPGAPNLISGNGANSFGIWNEGNSNQVLSNFIGTNGAGTAGYPVQSYYGIWSSTAVSVLTITGNVVGGHTARGMEISVANATSFAITGNYVGTDSTGTAIMGNGVDGIAITGPSPVSLKTGNPFDAAARAGFAPALETKSLRPVKPAAPPVLDLSGNTIRNNSWGLVLNNGIGLTVANNVIDANGIGIRMLEAYSNTISNNSIQGSTSYSGIFCELNSSTNSFLNNTIVGNAGPGVVLETGTGNVVLGNQIAGNGHGFTPPDPNYHLGIELRDGVGNYGPTPNDVLDSDSGTNGYQNYPEPVTAQFNGTATDVIWSVDSSGASGTAAMQVQIYKADALTPAQSVGAPIWSSGCLAGNTFTDQVATIAAPALLAGDTVVLTATSYADATCTLANDGTSELSPATTVTTVPGVVYTSAASGAGSLYQAILDANNAACAAPCSIQFHLPDSELVGTAPNRYWRIPVEPAYPLIVNAANVTIDGATQIAFRGSAANGTGGPEIFIDGTLAGGDGVIWNGNGTLTHVAVGNCSTGAGVKAAVPDVHVDYCSIGMTPLGSSAPNATGVFFQNGPGRIWFNKIKFNVGNAVTITGGSGVDIFWNDIEANGFGIDLDGDGATPNDDPAEDADAGGNGLQNYPTIKSAYNMGATTRLMFEIHSGTDTSTGSFQVALFLADASGQGMTQHAYVCVNGNPWPGGAWDVPSVDPAQGLVLTATAMTTCSGAITQGTSEFSPVFYASTPGEVTNTNDSGPGSLRDAMLAAGGGYCADPCTITFSGAGQGTINLLSPLPALLFVSNVTIDGFANGAGTPNTNPFGMPDNSTRSVQVLGPAPGSFDGFELGGNNNRIRGLVIGNLARGVWISNGSGGSVSGCFIGTDGLVGLNNATGVEVAEFATGATIGGLAPADRNVISSNNIDGTGQGINLNFATGVSILGNYIGTARDGVTPVPNYYGIYGFSANNNQIGTAAGPNLVSGSTQSGIALAGMSTGNLISGNRIGTIADGSAAAFNSYGIEISANSTSNTIGGATAVDGNLISGNPVGIFLDASSNQVYSNLIGTNAAGTAAVPNTSSAIVITSSGMSNVIGSAASPNTISGNNIPITILGIGNRFFYNTIGSATLPNTGAVQIEGGSNEFGFNTIAYNNLGIVVTSGTGNYFHSNEIHDNGGIAIDLDDMSHMNSGATPNDAADVDVGGGNNFQNYPVIESAKMNGADLEIRFNVDSSSTSNTSLFVEFFKAGVNGSLQSLTTACYDTNNIPAGTLVTIASAPVTAADSIVATATGNASVCPMVTLADGTSEYSPAFAINGPPTAVADSFTTAEDTALLATVLSNDTDPDLDTLTISGNTAATNGSVVCTITDCTYTPFGDYNGGDTFDYTITDGTGETSTATVTLTVTPVNDPPVATTELYTTAEDTPLTIGAPGVLANDTDIDSAPSSFVASIASPASNGIVGLNADGSFTYTPTLDYSGPDSFAYNVDDGAGGIAMGFVNLTVTAVNDPPVATADSYTTSEDMPLSIPSPGLLSNDTDVDSAPQFFMSTLATPATNGTVDVLGSDGSFTYTPYSDFSGSDSFTYTLDDGNGGSATGTVSITVTGVNDPPVAVGDSYTTAEDTPLTIPAPGVLGNDTDVDGPALTATLTTPADYGMIVLNLDGSFTYTPAADMTGTVYASYTVSDGAGGNSSTSITIDVTPLNDPPVAVADGYMTSEDIPLAVGASMGLLSNDTDVDNAPSSLVAALGTPPLNGNVTVNGDGSFSYTPMPDYNGTDSFTYTVSDGVGGITPGSVSMLVSAVNDAPVALDDTAASMSAAAVTTAVLSNDNDVEADPLTVVSWTSPANGNVTCSSFDCTYASNPNFAGTDTYTYTITDGFATATATVTVTVTLESDVMISISATPEPVSAGSTITWMIGVGFAGGPNVSATGVVITDVVPAGVTNLTVDSALCSISGNTVTCNAPGIGIGFLPIHITGTAPMNGGILTNTVTITTTSSDPNLANNTSSVDTTVYSTTFTVTSFADSGPGSLRQAILDANSGACASPCTITFNLPPPVPAAGYFKISPSTPLPDITASDVTIDATSQTSATGDTNAAGPEVVLDGSLLGAGGNGLRIIGGSNNTIRGLGFIAFAGAAITVDGSGASGNNIAGNFIGTDGSTALGTGNGIVLGPLATNTLVGGPIAIPKAGGITLVTNGNVISGNSGTGLAINGNGNTAIGNFIGTDATGTTPIPNGVGVVVVGSSNVIGGTLAGAANVIAFNTSQGLRVDSGTGNRVRANSIHDNGALGIDLAPVGVTANDAGDGDTGANDLQNSPAIGSASFDGVSTTITGSLDTAVGTYDLDFFENTTADPSGSGEGQTYLGSLTVSTSTGPTPFTFTVSGDHTAKYLSATATSAAGSTSEFAVVLSADLQVTITPPAAIVPGSSAAYTITVTNNGPSAASSITVTDTTPTGFAFVSNSGACTTAYPCTIASFASGASQTITTTFSVPAAYTTPNPASNTATVSSTLPDPNTLDNTATVSTAVAVNADLQVAKTASSPSVIAESALNYTLNVTNAGPSDAANVTVTDTLPAGYVVGSITQTGWTCSQAGQTITCTAAVLGAGLGSTITINGTAPPTAGTITNTATVASPAADPVSTNNTSSVATTVATNADLSISKTAGANPVDALGSFTYTLTVTNLGPNTATAIQVVDTLPAGMTYVSATGAGWTCSQSAGVVTCALPTLGSSSISQITLAVNAPAAAGSITNTASVSSATTDPVSTNNSASATTTVNAAADLAITKTASAPTVVAGSALNYLLNVNNLGPSDAASITVTDTLPAGYVVASIAQTGWNCAQSGQTVTCTTSLLGAGIGSTITINGTAPDPAPTPTPTVTNTATVSSLTADPVSTNNTSSATTTVEMKADLSITKTANANPVNALGSFTYTLTVTNLGPNTASSVQVVDTLPAGMTYVNASGAGWTCSQNAGVVTCTRPTLGSSSTSQITLAVGAPAAAGSITNTASVSSATTDLVSTNNSASAATTVTAVADLAITKTASANPVAALGSFNYTLTVTNLGPSTAGSVAVSDTLPAGMTYVSASGSGWTCAQSAGVVSCTLATLTANTSSQITLAVKAPPAGGSITNTASVSSAATDPVSTNNSASATTTVNDVADLTITKTANVTTAVLGDTVIYTINVKNNGPSPAQGVTVTDPTPAALIWISNSGACTTAFPCTLGTLGAGVTKTITATFEVSGKSPTTLVNTATLASTTTDPSTADNSASASINTCPVAVVAMRPVPNSTGAPTTGLLNWERVDAATYTVYLGEVGTGCQTRLGATASNQLQYSNLKPGTVYEWRVVADKPGCGAASSACVKFTTSPKPCENPAPSLIEPATGANVASNPVTFSWTAANGAIGYNVYAGVNGAAPSVIAPTTTETTLSVDVAAGAVVWYVEALFDDCPATRSVQGTFTAGPIPCDTHLAPEPLLPNDESTLTSPVQFSWTPVPAATGYRVWVSIADAFPFIVASTATETTAIASVPAGALHWFVEALFEGCPPTLSVRRALSVTPASTCPTTPPSPNEPADGVTLSSPVTFSWSEVPDAFGYTVWLGVDGEAPSIVGTTSGVNATTLTRDVQAGKARWFVEAMIANCNPLRSVMREFTVPVTLSCDNASPVLTSPAAGATDQPGLVEFTWNAVDKATEYRVWAKVDGGAEVVFASTLVTTKALAPAYGTTVEWWVQALFNGCPSTVSEHRTFTLAGATSCSGEKPVLLAPSNQSELSERRVLLSWSSVAGAIGYRVRASVNQGASATVAIVYSPTTAVTVDMPYGTIGWYVEAITSGCPLVPSDPGIFTVKAATGCDLRAARLVAPPNGVAGLTSPVQFGWTAVDRAAGYRVWVSFAGAAFTQLGNVVTTTSVTSSVPQGLVRWYVEAVTEGCDDVRSSPNEFTVVAAPPCTTPGRPVPALVAQITAEKTYRLSWTPVAGSTIYEVQESAGTSFTGAPVTVVQGTFVERMQTVAGTYSYRVRAIGDCNQERGPYSEVVRVRVTEEESQGGAEAGDTGTVTTLLQLCLNEQGQVVICEGTGKRGKTAVHPNDGPTTVGVSTSTGWMSVSPATVTIPPNGSASVTVTSTTGGLPPGANTGAVTATPTNTNAAPSNLPNTVSLVTPVSPTPRNEPAPESLIIPAVAHASGTNSTWLSDIRLANIASQLVNYQINFTPAGITGTQVGQQTTLSLDGGKTTALNDIVASWFGGGSAGQAASGVLEIRPMNAATSALSTIASSRTYNQSAAGTFGQFIPAVLYSQFVGKAPDAQHPTTLSLQQIAQSQTYRTNFGLVEASGHPVTVEFTVFGTDGAQITSFPLSLQAGEYRQFNALLAEKGITLEDGRVEIRVTSDEGKVTAYASVVDNATNDPLVVPAVQLVKVSTDKYIIPGVAEVNTGEAHWRTDMRMFNASPSVIHATARFYPQGNPADEHSAEVTIQPGEVKVINRAVATLFGLDNAVGVIHVSTLSATALIVTARTYDQQPTGTYGQFIPAMTVADSIGTGDRPLQILQLEQSDAFRTNVGIAEVTGKAANIELVAAVPDRTTAAVLPVSLRPNEFVQLSRVLSQMGLTNVYNARISVRVVSGQGRVIAYGSVVDNQTQDPTYVPAQ